MGSNKRGQLGLGHIDPTHLNIISPLPVPSFGDLAKQVACGNYFTLILNHSGMIYSCGDNDNG